ncbi:peroxisome assembly protein 12-like isoform X2 [Physella acuta]|uniref:peroxisome assembly protein 12-like isoform X2 n=1 Tax=Physella acuta TaxID=109671 RepID=UPI0027DE42F6|nr:peroxisome assembly protein 12-like isoform X2 [Physella acuta]
MAEHGAHLTSFGSEDAQRPSVFEVLAQQSLMSTVRPAFLHAVKVFAEKYPAYLGKLYQYYDEIFLLFDIIVQSHYLKRYGGSFAENFYDLKRVPSLNTESSSLTPKQLGRSVACLVFIPYLRQKLDNLFEELRYRNGTDRGIFSFLKKNLTIKQRLVYLYLAFYPYIHSAWECLSLAYMLSYMLRKGRWHSPSMHLSGTVLQRLEPTEESSGIFSAKPAWSELSPTGKFYRVMKLGMSTTAVCLSTSLSVGVFFLQFLDWWYATDSSAPSLTALPIPEPPEAKLKGVDPSTCPLCMCLRTNSTALTVSGFVFCYPCISDHLRQNKFCPITGYPATSENLVKIYEQDI